MNSIYQRSKSNPLHGDLNQNYHNYHIPELARRWIKRKDIAPFIDQLKAFPAFDISVLGKSVEGRDINLVKIGRGACKILLWSQMHGDESTATRALLEICRFFTTKDHLEKVKELILAETTLLFIPMLNPDGAELYQRQNALSIDINRDALRLIAPESRILKDVLEKYQPEFGFNLHDQSIYYNVGQTNKTAAISFLAPAYNFEKEVNEGRGKAIKLIVAMDKILQQYIPGHVGRFNDEFEPRAFGDNIQKWGTSTVLIESGGLIGDPEKKHLVKMNFLAILHALESIAGKEYENVTLDNYFSIPENDKKFFDLLVRNGEVVKFGKTYKTDIGINIKETRVAAGSGFCREGEISDLGDLSVFYGYEELDASGMVISCGAVYPEVIQDSRELSEENVLEWLRSGYTTVCIKNVNAKKQRSALPIFIVSENNIEEAEIKPEARANFIIRKGNEVVFAIVNGRLIELG